MSQRFNCCLLYYYQWISIKRMSILLMIPWVVYFLLLWDIFCPLFSSHFYFLFFTTSAHVTFFLLDTNPNWSWLFILSLFSFFLLFPTYNNFITNYYSLLNKEWANHWDICWTYSFYCWRYEPKQKHKQWFSEISFDKWPY